MLVLTCAPPGMRSPLGHGGKEGKRNEGEVEGGALPLPCYKVTHLNSAAFAQVYIMFSFSFFKAFPLGSRKKADLQPKCLPLVIFPLITLSLSQGLLWRIYRLN